jgi:hypothetical protein
VKIVSWNMGAAPRIAKYRKRQTAAWRYLLATLRPDVAFVQEALFTNPITDDDGSLTWNDEAGRRASVARSSSSSSARNRWHRGGSAVDGAHASRRMTF